MRPLSISIVTPAARGSRKGNRVTALRWAGILRGLGHRVRIGEEYRGEPCELLVALHARRSFPSVKRFSEERPEGSVVVALTGTDLYQDLRGSAEAQGSLALASRLVVLQPLGIEELPAPHRAKARAILQSAARPRSAAAPVAGEFPVCVLGHLRAVKDPFRAADASRLLPEGSRVRVLHLGEALEPGMEERARAEMAENPRYRWLGGRPRREALRLLAGCKLLVLSSLVEGGANVLSEALACGVPVLSSAIPGSIGILGPGYPGYFPAGDTAALAALLARAESDPAFLGELRRRCEAVRPMLSPEVERECWARLIGEIGAGRRLHVVRGAAAPGRADFARDVKEGLSASPKRLPCRWFYDEAGSRIFEEITRLPEYELPRAEREILLARAPELAALLPAAPSVMELGSGSSAKTEILLEAILRRHGAARYLPVDISESALFPAARRLLEAHPGLEVVAIAGDYEDGLRRLPGEPGPRLVLWLGSNIGNLERSEAAAFLSRLRGLLAPGDRILVGIDLRKARATLEAAYDDAQGVTARFNLNLLARIDAELGGGFDLGTFRHRARYDEERGRVEMHLVSRRAQRVRIDALGMEVELAEGETIHTENSYKYSLDEIAALARDAGLRVERRWLDGDRRFASVLLAV